MEVRRGASTDKRISINDVENIRDSAGGKRDLSRINIDLEPFGEDIMMNDIPMDAADINLGMLFFHFEQILDTPAFLQNACLVFLSALANFPLKS